MDKHVHFKVKDSFVKNQLNKAVNKIGKLGKHVYVAGTSGSRPGTRSTEHNTPSRHNQHRDDPEGGTGCFEPPGSLSTGMSCELLVVFEPQVNEDVEGEIRFASATGPFSVPVRCCTKKCQMEVDCSFIDFGSQVVGQAVTRCFTLTNRGALGCDFRLDMSDENGPKTGPLCSRPVVLLTPHRSDFALIEHVAGFQKTSRKLRGEPTGDRK
ncbi:hypothetical protein WMY93_029352 [Mugilogobius chulae]|uniref:CFAP74 second Ig-like domain-containing protein n=1 Tax=Mugilogobius chulae TaxID=88201 RepID=A0AAW0MR20_9GOBI